MISRGEPWETVSAAKAGRMVARILLHLDWTSDYAVDDYYDEDRLLLAIWDAAALLHGSASMGLEAVQKRWDAFRDAFEDETIEHRNAVGGKSA